MISNIYICTVCSEIIGTPLSFDEIKILLMNTHVIDHETVHLHCSLEQTCINVIRLVGKILLFAVS